MSIPISKSIAQSPRLNSSRISSSRNERAQTEEMKADETESDIAETWRELDEAEKEADLNNISAAIITNYPFRFEEFGNLTLNDKVLRSFLFHLSASASILFTVDTNKILNIITIEAHSKIHLMTSA